MHLLKSLLSILEDRASLECGEREEGEKREEVIKLVVLLWVVHYRACVASENWPDHGRFVGGVARGNHT